MNVQQTLARAQALPQLLLVPSVAQRGRADVTGCDLRNILVTPCVEVEVLGTGFAIKRNAALTRQSNLLQRRRPEDMRGVGDAVSGFTERYVSASNVKCLLFLFHAHRLHTCQPNWYRGSASILQRVKKK